MWVQPLKTALDTFFGNKQFLLDMSGHIRNFLDVWQAFGGAAEVVVLLILTNSPMPLETVETFVSDMALGKAEASGIACRIEMLFCRNILF